MKSKHLGLGLNQHRSHCLHRIEILLLIAALAHYLLFLTGLQARKSNLERRYQSNSLRERRVLSLWRLGLEYWRKCIEFGGGGDWETLEKALRDEVHHQAQSLECICEHSSRSVHIYPIPYLSPLKKPTGFSRETRLLQRAERASCRLSPTIFRLHPTGTPL